jgi:hypothetical protein
MKSTAVLAFVLGMLAASMLWGTALAGNPLFDNKTYIAPYGAACQTATPNPPTETPAVVANPTDEPIPTRVPPATPWFAVAATPPPQAVWLPAVQQGEGR